MATKKFNPYKLKDTRSDGFGAALGDLPKFDLRGWCDTTPPFDSVVPLWPECVRIDASGAVVLDAMVRVPNPWRIIPVRGIGVDEVAAWDSLAQQVDTALCHSASDVGFLDYNQNTVK